MARRGFQRGGGAQGGGGRSVAFTALVLVAAALAPLALAPAPAQAESATPTFTLAWVHELPDQNVYGLSGSITEASPIEADLPGGPAVVVGDTGGSLWAFNLATGQPVPGWPAHTGPLATAPVLGPIASPASAYELPGQAYDTVFVGVGDSAYPEVPYAYEAFNPNGTLRWAETALDPEPPPNGLHGDQAGLTVAGSGSSAELVGPSMGMADYGLDPSTGAVRWEFLNYDSDFSTPAAGHIFGNDRTQIVDGGDSTLNPTYPLEWQQGGHLRIWSPSGEQLCQLEPQPDQTVDSSPAIGRIFGGAWGIVSGTGYEYPVANDTDKLIAMTPTCTLRWIASLYGTTLGSPALANVVGSPGGKDQIVEATSTGGSSPGYVYVLTGSGLPAQGWAAPRATTAPVFGEGSVATADLSGQGYQDLVVPTVSGADVFDGRSGRLVAVVGQGLVALQSTPLITKQGHDEVGITLAGYKATNVGCPLGQQYCAEGVIAHYVVFGPGVGVGPSDQSWPMFHHDPQLSGDQKG